MAKIKVALVKDLITQVSNDKISFSRMCELLNEEASRKEINIIAYEWHNHETGHCYVGYVPHSGMDEKDGYLKTPLVYERKKETCYPLNFKG